MILNIGYNIDVSDDLYHITVMTDVLATQPEQAIALLKKQGLVRLGEFTSHGIAAATVRRMAQKGQVTQLARGLYQLPGAELDANHTLAEAAKLVPQGVICLTSALAYHELTDTPGESHLRIGVQSKSIVRELLKIGHDPRSAFDSVLFKLSAWRHQARA